MVSRGEIEEEGQLSIARPLPSPTRFKDNPYRHEWAKRDFLHVVGGVGEFPKHVCKGIYLISKPFIKNFRNAVDIGCRVGEFTRYLHRDFEHVYAFDPRMWPHFRFNVDLKKVTHFTCALGDQPGEIEMFGGSHSATRGAQRHIAQVFTLDDFDLQNVDYIKIDVEGYEKKVLLGAARTIERDNPVIVIEQNHVILEGDVKYSARTYLESIGYRQVAFYKGERDFVMVRDRP